MTNNNNISFGGIKGFQDAADILKDLNIDPEKYLKSVPYVIGKVGGNGRNAADYTVNAESPAAQKGAAFTTPNIGPLNPVKDKFLGAVGDVLGPVQSLVETATNKRVARTNYVTLDPQFINNPVTVLHEFSHAFESNLNDEDYHTLENLIKNNPLPEGGITRHHPTGEGTSLPNYFEYAYGGATSDAAQTAYNQFEHDWASGKISNDEHNLGLADPDANYRKIPEPILEFIRRKTQGLPSGTTAGDGWTVQTANPDLPQKQINNWIMNQK